MQRQQATVDLQKVVAHRLTLAVVPYEKETDEAELEHRLVQCVGRRELLRQAVNWLPIVTQLCKLGFLGWVPHEREEIGQLHNLLNVLSDYSIQIDKRFRKCRLLADMADCHFFSGVYREIFLNFEQ